MFFHQLRISGQIRKQDGQVAALALRYNPDGIGLRISIRLPRHRRGGWIQCRTALTAKFAAERIGRPASTTALSDRTTTLSAKFGVSLYLGVAMGAFHNQTFTTLLGANFYFRKSRLSKRAVHCQMVPLRHHRACMEYSAINFNEKVSNAFNLTHFWSISFNIWSLTGLVR
jgi:hypothetical protein